MMPGNKSCLIVEKNHDISKRIKKKAEIYYGNVNTAPTIKEAKEKLLNTYHALILDIRTPESNGLISTSELPALSFLKTLQKNSIEKYVIVGFQEEELITEIEKIGVKSIIRKGPEFLDELEKALKSGRPSISSQKCRLHVDVIQKNDNELEVMSFLDDYCVGPYYTKPDEVKICPSFSSIVDKMKEIPEQYFSTPLGPWDNSLHCIGKIMWKILNGSPRFYNLYSNAKYLTKEENIIIVFSGKNQILKLPFELALPNADNYLLFQHPVLRQVTDIRPDRYPLYLLEDREERDLRALLVAADTNNRSNPVTINSECLKWPDVKFDSIPGVSKEVAYINKKLAEDRRFEQPTVLAGNVTEENLLNVLKENKYDLFHFAGHGYHCESDPDLSAIFVWDNSNSERIKPIYIYELKDLLKDAGVKFAYFGCCQGADTTSPSQNTGFSYFQGMLEGAVWASVPTVLAFRWPIFDKAAYNFAKSFYDEWLESGSFASALLKARKNAKKCLKGNYAWAASVMTSQDHGQKRSPL